MTRLGVVFWCVLVAVAGFTTFKVKYAVQDIEDQLNRVRRHTIAEQQEIRVLTADWTFLNQPERLVELNRRFLQLAPIAAKQMQRGIADIPLRAPAAPAAPPDAPPDAMPDVLTRASLDQAAPPTPAALPVTPAVLAPAAPSPAGAKPAARVQLAKAGTGPEPGALDALIAKADRAPAPGGLDALISQIADTR